MDADIFDGITIGDGGAVLTRAKYVPAERVGGDPRGRDRARPVAGEAAKLEPYMEQVEEPLADLRSRTPTEETRSEPMTGGGGSGNAARPPSASDDLAFTPALELAARVRARAVSPVELAELYLERIERIDPEPNGS